MGCGTTSCGCGSAGEVLADEAAGASCRSAAGLETPLSIADDGAAPEGCSTGDCAGCAFAAAHAARAIAPVESPAPTRPEPAAVAFTPTEAYPEGLFVGLDIGSTTVKAVVVDPRADAILWKDYQRHDTRQAEKCIEFLHRIEADFAGVPRSAFRVFMTGSGAGTVAPRIGGRFVQEVNAVSLAVEKLHPDVLSVVELGGQDAKIIVFKEDEASGRKKKIPSMNDKCAGGTGAVIDKINAKLRIPPDRLREMGYDGLKLHPVAGKCGVFAETDINGLQKSGVPADELMASLFESIIQQNLSVLTRGHTLRPKVLLLGGPNTFIRGMVECWRHAIPQVWKERNVRVPEGASVEDLVVVPDNGEYFAALGAVEFGRVEVLDHPDTAVYLGTDELDWYVHHGRLAEKIARGSRGLSRGPEDLAAFLARYERPAWAPPPIPRGGTVRAFLGLDGGSTSTKGVLLDENRTLIAKAYQLSKGNPIEDMVEIVGELRRRIEAEGATLEILGAGTTGYAKDVLGDVIGADAALVETVAHTSACLHHYPDSDVIVDVGGQDIKLIVLKHGQVKDFKLNTQCSAGNGYFLQGTSEGFGFPVERFADMAFAAEAMPDFGYGCAVFMQSDIVDFQRQGWQAHEIMAGLAAVLPKNIWLYVSQIPNLAKLGTHFVLQGGTQRNLAAVKAQVDFITERFRGTGLEPTITVHEHCGESGAIGSALEAHRLWAEQGRSTGFIGLDAVARIAYRTTRSEETRCYFCKNNCMRTFIDVTTAAGPRAHDPHALALTRAGHSATADLVGAAEPHVDLTAHTTRHRPEEGHPSRLKRGSAKGGSKVPLAPGDQRLIIATCEKGTVEDLDDMREIKAGLDAVKLDNPNLVEMAAHEVFRPTGAALVADPPPKVTVRNFLKRQEITARAAAMARRATWRVGIPRVLNMYSCAPFFLAWFESLGVPAKNIVFSDETSEELYKEGAKRGAVDPCFPSKLGIPHVHNLLVRKHDPSGTDRKRKKLDCIFFPMIDAMPGRMTHVMTRRTCPTVANTPAAVKAAFLKEGDVFADYGVRWIDPLVDLMKPLLCARVLAEAFRDEIGVGEEESRRAVEAGLAALAEYEARMRRETRTVLTRLEREKRLGIVVLARPYHADPGVNHGILEELQAQGYPILSQDYLPTDPKILERLFGEEVRAGVMKGPLAIDDVWKNSYSENTTRKLWAAKFVARHPNLVALELSSFKCGLDAPIYSVIEEIVEASGTPYFSFKDIDENKPAGSIRLRIETIAYFLSRWRERSLPPADMARRKTVAAKPADPAPRPLENAVAD